MVRHTTATSTSGLAERPTATQGEPSDLPLTKRELGAYYTPSALASLLAKWAIRSCNERVLEPGFGGCGFLQAAIDRLTTLGSPSPKNQLFGCDIDPQAFSYLADKLGVLSIEQRYVLSDFITVSPQSFSTQAFDVVIGNPPYVSLHNMSANQKASVQAWKEKTGIKINGRASLWAYFVLHAMSFLKLGGRMAWVLPGSFLKADYATSLRSFISVCFEEVVAIQLTERMFVSVGAEERTVVLLCSGFGGSTKGIKISHCASANQLESEIATYSQDNDNAILGKQNSPLHLQDTQSEACIYSNLSTSADAVYLGDLCKVLIGTVTGANHFFIMSPSRAKLHLLAERNLKPILSKFAHIQGAQINETDIENWQAQDKPCLLFYLPDKRISQAAANYVATFPDNERLHNSTFRRRKDWLRADDGRIPDAFFSYMMHDGPRMALNNASINATNSIHRVFFNPTVKLQVRKLAVVSLCSTFSQLSAEQVGRSYGSGVLKIEPSEANRIKLILPKDKTVEQTDAAFLQIDACFRHGNSQGAQKIADMFIFGGRKNSDREQIIFELNSELEIARNRRRRQRIDV
jgi:adenine-specific DNA-methyltransferase